jgi:hypothetical protein
MKRIGRQVDAGAGARLTTVRAARDARALVAHGPLARTQDSAFPAARRVVQGRARPSAAARALGTLALPRRAALRGAACTRAVTAVLRVAREIGARSRAIAEAGAAGRRADAGAADRRCAAASVPAGAAVPRIEPRVDALATARNLAGVGAARADAGGDADGSGLRNVLRRARQIFGWKDERLGSACGERGRQGDRSAPDERLSPRRHSVPIGSMSG